MTNKHDTRFRLHIRQQPLPDGHLVQHDWAGFHVEAIDTFQDDHAHAGFLAPRGLLAWAKEVDTRPRLLSWLAKGLCGEDDPTALEIVEDALAQERTPQADGSFVSEALTVVVHAADERHRFKWQGPGNLEEQARWAHAEQKALALERGIADNDPAPPHHSRLRM